MQGEYLKLAVGTFNYHCSGSLPHKIIPFLEKRLSGCAISVQKHYLRWYFVYMGGCKAKLEEAIDSAEEGTTKLELLKVVYSKMNDYEDEAWPLLKICLDTIKVEDKRATELLFTVDTIDDRFVEHLPDFFRAIFAYSKTLEKAQKSDLETFLTRAANQIRELPQDLAQAMCERVLREDFSGRGDTYLKSFCLHNLPTNLEFFTAKIDRKIKVNNEAATRLFKLICKNICMEALNKKRESLPQTADMLLVPQTLLKLLSSDPVKFYTNEIYVRLIQLLIPLAPTHNADDEAMAIFIRDYTSQALTLLCGQLEQVDVHSKTRSH